MTVLLAPAAMKLQSIYRFTVDIRNPPYPVVNASMEVRAMKEYSSVIVAYGLAANVFSTNQLYMTYQEIFIGWGLRPDPKLLF